MEDGKILMDWRNDPETIKASINNKKVTMKEHFEWLQNIIDDPDRQLYIAYKQEDNELIFLPVGCCRSDYKEHLDVYELSWTVAPEARGKGIGKEMIKLLGNKLEHKWIVAEVKKDNIASQKIALFIGMRLSWKSKDGMIHYIRQPLDFSADLK